MDNRFDENVLAELKPVFEENGFSVNENGNFSDGTKEFSVKYDDEKQMYRLFVKYLTEESGDGEKELNAWLFDDSQNAKDASAVGIDFVSSVKKELGIKQATRTSNSNIDLPTASKNGAMTVTGFTKKMLDVYPSLKDNYKDHIARYGNFLYINFFGEYLVPCYKETFKNGGKKQIKKLYDVLADAYVSGDKDTVNILVAVLCASAYNDETVTNNIKEMLSDDQHFTTSFVNFLKILPKNKALFSALVK